MDKQTIQWILSVIAIPAITLLGWTVFENKSEIAVLDAKFTADHDILVMVSQQRQTPVLAKDHDLDRSTLTAEGYTIFDGEKIEFSIELD